MELGDQLGQNHKGNSISDWLANRSDLKQFSNSLSPVASNILKLALSSNAPVSQKINMFANNAINAIMRLAEPNPGAVSSKAISEEMITQPKKEPLIDWARLEQPTQKSVLAERELRSKNVLDYLSDSAARLTPASEDAIQAGINEYQDNLAHPDNKKEMNPLPKHYFPPTENAREQSAYDAQTKGIENYLDQDYLHALKNFNVARTISKNPQYNKDYNRTVNKIKFLKELFGADAFDYEQAQINEESQPQRKQVLR